MALPTSGKLSILDIVGEFGGSAPHALSEYYAAASGVPSSGVLSISDFYGASAVFTATINSNQTNLNLRSFALNAGWDGSSAVEINIASGVVISGSVQSNSTASLTVDGSWPGGVALVNNGIIQGRGGNGGSGGSGGGGNGASGAAGGRALLASTNVSIDNKGAIRGGGGGGGGGGGAGSGGGKLGITVGGSGGGGGRSSLVNSSGGAAGSPGGGDTTAVAGNPGSGGTISSSGAGGSSVIIGDGSNRGGAGGSGGNHGATGASGAAGTGEDVGSGGSGGAAGQAVSGNSNVTWLSTGTRVGPIV